MQVSTEGSSSPIPVSPGDALKTFYMDLAQSLHRAQGAQVDHDRLIPGGARPKAKAGQFDILDRGAEELKLVWNNVQSMQSQIKPSPRGREGRPLYAFAPYSQTETDGPHDMIPDDEHIIKAFVAVARRLRSEGNHLQAKRYLRDAWERARSSPGVDDGLLFSVGQHLMESGYIEDDVNEISRVMERAVVDTSKHSSQSSMWNDSGGGGGEEGGEVYKQLDALVTMGQRLCSLHTNSEFTQGNRFLLDALFLAHQHPGVNNPRVWTLVKILIGYGYLESQDPIIRRMLRDVVEYFQLLHLEPGARTSDIGHAQKSAVQQESSFVASTYAAAQAPKERRKADGKEREKERGERSEGVVGLPRAGEEGDVKAQGKEKSEEKPAAVTAPPDERNWNRLLEVLRNAHIEHLAYSIMHEFGVTDESKLASLSGKSTDRAFLFRLSKCKIGAADQRKLLREAHRAMQRLKHNPSPQLAPENEESATNNGGTAAVASGIGVSGAAKSEGNTPRLFTPKVKPYAAAGARERAVNLKPTSNDARAISGDAVGRYSRNSTPRQQFHAETTTVMAASDYKPAKSVAAPPRPGIKFTPRPQISEGDVGTTQPSESRFQVGSAGPYSQDASVQTTVPPRTASAATETADNGPAIASALARPGVQVERGQGSLFHVREERPLRGKSHVRQSYPLPSTSGPSARVFSDPSVKPAVGSSAAERGRRFAGSSAVGVSGLDGGSRQHVPVVRAGGASEFGTNSALRESIQDQVAQERLRQLKEKLDFLDFRRDTPHVASAEHDTSPPDIPRALSPEFARDHYANNLPLTVVAAPAEEAAREGGEGELPSFLEERGGAGVGPVVLWDGRRTPVENEGSERGLRSPVSPILAADNRRPVERVITPEGDPPFSTPRNPPLASFAPRPMVSDVPRRLDLVPEADPALSTLPPRLRGASPDRLRTLESLLLIAPSAAAPKFSPDSSPPLDPPSSPRPVDRLKAIERQLRDVNITVPSWTKRQSTPPLMTLRGMSEGPSAPGAAEAESRDGLAGRTTAVASRLLELEGQLEDLSAMRNDPDGLM